MKNIYQNPEVEWIQLSNDSNFATSFGGQIGDGSGSIKTNSVYENE